jgi:hypothetical protein
LEASGGLAEIMFQKAAQAFPAGEPACVRSGLTPVFRPSTKQDIPGIQLVWKLQELAL